MATIDVGDAQSARRIFNDVFGQNELSEEARVLFESVNSQLREAERPTALRFAVFNSEGTMISDKFYTKHAALDWAMEIHSFREQTSLPPISLTVQEVQE